MELGEQTATISQLRMWAVRDSGTEIVLLKSGGKGAEMGL